MTEVISTKVVLESEAEAAEQLGVTDPRLIKWMIHEIQALGITMTGECWLDIDEDGGMQALINKLALVSMLGWSGKIEGLVVANTDTGWRSRLLRHGRGWRSEGREKLPIGV